MFWKRKFGNILWPNTPLLSSSLSSPSHATTAASSLFLLSPVLPPSQDVAPSLPGPRYLEIDNTCVVLISRVTSWMDTV